MGWSNGTTIFNSMLRILQREIDDRDVRRAIIKDMIEVFEDADWDNLDEAYGIDIVYDELYEERERNDTIGELIAKYENLGRLSKDTRFVIDNEKYGFMIQSRVDDTINIFVAHNMPSLIDWVFDEIYDFSLEITDERYIDLIDEICTTSNLDAALGVLYNISDLSLLDRVYKSQMVKLLDL